MRPLLFFVLARKDISVRYKQTLIGVGWVVIKPLITTVIFTFIFGGLLGQADRDGMVKYSFIVYCSVLLFNAYQSAISEMSNCFVGNISLIQKTNIKKYNYALGALGVAFFDFVLVYIISLPFLIFSDVLGLYESFFLLVCGFICAVLGGLHGYGLAVANVYFRDVRYALPFLVQTVFYATPVGYLLTDIPEKYQTIILLNPISIIIEFSRGQLFAMTNYITEEAFFIFVSHLFLFLLINKVISSKYVAKMADYL